jgi:hypothetical protein
MEQGQAEVIPSGGNCPLPGSQDPLPRVDRKRCEVTCILERWSSAQGNLRAQNAAYRLAWDTFNQPFIGSLFWGNKYVNHPACRLVAEEAGSEIH